MLNTAEQFFIWRQWDKAVDFASPVSAWSDVMLDVVQEYGRPTDAKGWEVLRDEVRRREAILRDKGLA